MKLIGDFDNNREWLDYSTLSMLMRCPKMFYWRCVCGVTDTKPAAPLIFGHAIHKALAIYYEGRQAGAHPTVAMANGIAQSEAEVHAIVEDKKRNVTTFRNTLAGYLKRWENEPYSTAMVEVGFSVDLGDFVFIGRIDRVAQGPLGLVAMEQKTTTVVGERWEMRGKPNLQLDGYYSALTIYGHKLWGACLDVMHVHEDPTKAKPPFRIMTQRNDQDVDMWITNTKYWYSMLHSFKESKVWPMNTEACVPLVGFSCNYQSLCKLYPSPTAVDSFELPEQYKVEHWKPFDMSGGGD